MTVLTPNFSLPVPGPLDAPCDFPQQWCDFTDGVQTVLDGFETIANRTNPVVPLAKMQLLNTVNLLETSTVPFDTLTLNNAGMVDFDTSNTTIVIKRPGRFFAVFNALFVASAASNTYFEAQLLPTGAGVINQTTAIDDNFCFNSLINVGSTLSAVLYVTSPPVNVRVIVQIIGASENVLIDLASFSLFWFADRGAP